ncbi:ABC transporter ATP-binding protein [Corynebacterium sp. A21]|uniref:ABC transporter ATP-binding protein n=1 Tax=Corynebacterium sp. A21 TaxID=3457318 RepID=UPI003FD1B0BF
MVMGASGSGESTLLHCLGGLDALSAGSVDIAGRELSGMREKELSRLRLTQLGFIFQQAHFLVNLNIRDNILLPGLKAAPGNRAAELMVHLQRAAICRGLIARPAVLFADEPTGALTSAMSGEVMEALSAVPETGSSIVMVVHARSCAAHGDRVSYLRDGRVVAEKLVTWTAAAHSAREAKLIAWLDRQSF